MTRGYFSPDAAGSGNDLAVTIFEESFAILQRLRSDQASHWSHKRGISLKTPNRSLRSTGDNDVLLDKTHAKTVWPEADNRRGPAGIDRIEQMPARREPARHAR
jgi:hypothetical protein